MPKTNTKALSTNDLYGIEDADFIAFLSEQGYITFKKLLDGEWVSMMRLAFSVSVCCGIDLISPFKYRWCFSSEEAARDFYDSLTEFDAIPENQGALVGHRYGRSGPRLVLQDERGFDRW